MHVAVTTHELARAVSSTQVRAWLGMGRGVISTAT